MQMTIKLSDKQQQEYQAMHELYHRLSPVERQIAHLAASEDSSPRWIAQASGRSPKTVDSHLRNIVAKACDVLSTDSLSRNRVILLLCRYFTIGDC